jgi:hypothetical protein
MALDEDSTGDVFMGLVSAHIVVLRMMIKTGIITSDEAIKEFRSVVEVFKKQTTTHRPTEWHVFDRIIKGLSGPNAADERPSWTPVVIPGGQPEED